MFRPSSGQVFQTIRTKLHQESGATLAQVSRMVFLTPRMGLYFEFGDFGIAELFFQLEMVAGAKTLSGSFGISSSD
jgi:hypothetical protein